MSLRNRVNPQQLLAVSFALIMLVSMGGMAFVGGAGAQPVGGTYDSAIDSTDVGNDVNIANDSAVKTLGDASVNGDGSVTLDGSAGPGTPFDGVAVTPDRIDTLFDVDESFEDNPAAFLDAAPGTLSVEDSDTEASGAVFIEFAPQSEFSQIDTTVSGESGVSGTHDYIVVTTGSEAAELTDTQTDPGSGGGTLASDGTTGADDIVAISVNNTDSTDYSLLADAGTGTHGDALDSLVGTQENTLQDKNVDDALFAAGTFGASTSTITAFDVGDGTDSRLVHSEQVALNPGGNSDFADYEFFTSVNGAVDAVEGGAGDVITVADGTYDGGNNTADDTEITADESDLTIVGEGDPTLGEDVTAGAANVTIDSVTVEDADVALNGNDPTVLNSTVNASGNAITVDSEITGEVTVDGNDLNAADTTTVDSADIGLDLGAPDSATVANNNFAGFETQINNPGANVNATALRDDNTFAQLAVPVDADNNVVSADGDIYGSINAADADAGAAGNTIAVGSGTYDEGLVNIETSNVVVSGDADNRPTITDNVDLSSTNEVTFENFVLEGSLSDDGGASDVTIRSVDLDEQQLEVDAAESVILEDLSLAAVGDADAITIPDSHGGDVLVNDVNITGISGSTNTGVLVDDGSENVNLTDVTVTATDDAEAVDGIYVENIDNAAAAANEYTVDNATLTNLGNGTGINLQIGTQGSNGVISITDNTVRGGETLTGVQYNLPRAEDVTITGNTIVGANVAGGSSSVGFEFEAITGFGADPFAGSGDDSIPFTGNTVTGHAQLIAETDTEDDSVISEDGYDAILDPANNNEFGTLVIGPDGASYEDTYGTVDNLDVDTGNSYLPGSIDEAADLVDAAANVDASELEAQDPDNLEGIDSYDDADPIDFPEGDGIAVTGEDISGDEQVLVESRFLIPEGNAELNNHSVSNLAIEVGAETAISVESDNAQSTFDDLDVEAAGTGLAVTSDTGDVNVIEVTNSQFNITGTGADVAAIDLAATGQDDRDGFVIDDVTLTGPGVAGASTGLDLTNVEKPGKEGIVQLRVEELDVDGFERQLVLSESLAGPNTTAETVLNNSVDADPVVFDQNSFEEAVLVFTNESRTELAQPTTLYGSIDTAEADAADETDAAEGDVVDVRGTTRYAEDVTVSSDNVLLRGPQANTTADAELRDGGEAIIEGTVTFDSDLGENAEMNGFTVIGQTDELGDEDPVITVDTDSTVEVGVNSTAVTLNESNTDRQRGIEALGAGDENVVISQSFIGDHEAGGTVNQAVVFAAGALEVTDSQITAGDNPAFTPDTPATPEAGVIVGDTPDDGGTIDITNTTVEGYATPEGNLLIQSPYPFLDASGTPGDALNITDSTIEDGAVNILDASGVNVADTEFDTTRLQLGFAGNVGDLTIEDSSITNAAGSSPDTQGAILLSDVGTTDITKTTVTDGDIPALFIESGTDADDITLRGNTFSDNTGAAIVNEDGAALDATLNYFGAPAGPTSDEATGIEGDITYDPFLTEDLASTPVPADEIDSTTSFGHDVVIPANSITTVGFPAEPESTGPGEPDLAHAFNEDMNGTVYAFNKTTESFVPIDEPSEFESRDIEAFDAFVVQNTENESETALVDYKANPDPSEIADNRYEFQSGLNFVAPQQAGTVNDVLFPGGDTDVVAQPFSAGENLYGDTAATQVRDSFVTPAGAGFGENFRSGAGDRVVHPHAGYLVIVNEESNEGLEVTERISTPNGPTADNIETRTDGTGNGEFQINNVTAVDSTSNASNTTVTVELENTGDFDGVQDVTATFVNGGAEDASTTESVQIDSGSIDVVELTIPNDGNAAVGDTVVVTTDDDTQSAQEQSSA